MNFSHGQFSRFSFRRQSRGGGEPPQFLRNPRFDWRVALISFLVLNLASAAVHFLFYQQVGSGEIFLTEKREALARPPLNRFELEETVARFEERRARFEELKRKPLFVMDPFTPPPEAQKK